jgi:antirestriction protein
MKTTTTTTARLYVGTYFKYNNGSLKGAWLDLQDYGNVEEFYTACAELHKDEEDPEFMYQDYEGFPDCYYSESSVDSRLWDEYFPACQKYEEDAVNAFISLYSADDLAHFEDSYQGAYDSPAEYAEEFTEQCYDLKGLPDFIRYCIDWDRVADQMEINFEDGYVFTDF